VRGMIRRSLRLELVRGLGIALAIPALLGVAASAQSVATTTTLTTETRDQAGRTHASVAVNVTGEDGLPATGAVVLKDNGKQLAGAALDVDGKANVVLGLASGSHKLSAVYSGDSTRQTSASSLVEVQAQATTTASYTIGASPATLSLTAGQTGTVAVSVTPANNSTLTAPVFVTLSCSGLPDQATCTFTPATVEILSTTASALSSSMVITTVASTASTKTAKAMPSSTPVAWAFLLPGALCFAGLAWGGRRRRWLSRVSLIALVGVVTLLGTTACNPRYSYLNHGPTASTGTPAGTYTVTVSAQSNNGVTATTEKTTMALTVK
jgi:hypothetical protein